MAGLVAVIGGLLTLAVWVVPDVLVPQKGLTQVDRLKALNDARAPLVTVIGGLFLFTAALIGAYFTARTIQVNREANEITRRGQESTLEITRQTLEVTRQGQITDRFTRAIDQLGQHGEDKLDVRLGGIYALERIARESAEHHGPIMEVLTAYLREHARVRADGAARWQPVRAAGPLQPGERAERTDADEPPRLSADIQAVATVLGRRLEQRRRQEQRPLNLREVDLRAADLAGVHLERADLDGAHLEGAHLDGAHLERAFLYGAHLEEGAILYGAHLEKAILSGAQMKGADLRDAHLEGAFLGDVHLEGAYLFDAHLEGAILFGAHLEEAILSGAQMKGANLRDAHLEGAALYGAHLEGAILMLAHLEGATLDGARLEEANLRGAQLERADLRGAHLQGADLRFTDLSRARRVTRAQLEAAVTDETTIWPVFDEEGRAVDPDEPSVAESGSDAPPEVR